MIQSQIQQDLGRAKNVLQDYLIRKLLVPKIYLDADWNGAPVDVLAIDRAGVGDVHAVRTVTLNPDCPDDAAFVQFASKVDESVIGFRSFPSHYRYVAVVNDRPNARIFKHGDEITRKSLAEDGVGRVGILYVDLSKEDPGEQIRVPLKAERFRSSKEIVDLADRYVAEHTPNWEVRE